MGAVDRTLLASLGFGDADKKEPDHGIACRYLTSECRELLVAKFLRKQYDHARSLMAPSWEINRRGRWNVNTAQAREALIQAFLNLPSPRQDASGCWYTDGIYYNVSEIQLTVSGETEVPVGKGFAQYKTTIGFLDAFLTAKLQYQYHYIAQRIPHRYGEPDPITQREWAERTIDKRTDQEPAEQSIGEIVCEVKIRPVPLADAIRQIKLYREYKPATCWILVAPWELTEGDLAALSAEDIAYLRLGEKFQEYKKRQQEQPAATTDEI